MRILAGFAILMVSMLGAFYFIRLSERSIAIRSRRLRILGQALSGTMAWLFLLSGTAALQVLYLNIAHGVANEYREDWILGGRHHAGTNGAILGALLIPGILEIYLSMPIVKRCSAFRRARRHWTRISAAVASGCALVIHKSIAWLAAYALGVEADLFFPALKGLSASIANPFLYAVGFAWAIREILHGK